MATPPGTSLLLTLLEGVEYQVPKYTRTPLEPTISAAVQKNIANVIDAIKPHPQPNLIKDIARKELYELLYSIIQKEYDESKKDPQEDQQNPILNGAIGMALETAIREASAREASGKASESDLK